MQSLIFLKIIWFELLLKIAISVSEIFLKTPLRISSEVSLGQQKENTHTKKKTTGRMDCELQHFANVKDLFGNPAGIIL